MLICKSFCLSNSKGRFTAPIDIAQENKKLGRKCQIPNLTKKRRKAIQTLREQRFQIDRERLFNCLPKNIRGIYNTVRLNWKLLSWSKMHEIEPFKSYMEATTAGSVEQEKDAFFWMASLSGLTPLVVVEYLSEI